MDRFVNADGKNGAVSYYAVDRIENKARVSCPQHLVLNHRPSSSNDLPIENSRRETTHSLLDGPIHISMHNLRNSGVIDGLSSAKRDSNCIGTGSKSQRQNHCRNNNNERTSSRDNALSVETEYRYKGTAENDASRKRTVKKSRLVIVVLVCIIAGLAAGLVYFLLHDDTDRKDTPPSGSGLQSNQTIICAKIPLEYLSSALHDGIRTETDDQANNKFTIATTMETVSEGLHSGDLPKRTPVQARIYGGTSVAISRFPWQVSLWLKGRGMYCGGALIMPNWIVTAAHCTYYDRNATNWTGYVGVSRLSAKSSFPAQAVKIERIFVNPNYEESWNYDNDLTLLQLTESVTFSSRVQPICLPQPDQEFGNKSSCFISGWGSTVNTGAMVPPDTLQSGQVDIIPHETCRSEGWLGQFLVTDNMICAGKADGSVDACSGDSGGPLSCYEKERGVWVLAGVVSFGKGCGQPKQPGVYTKMSVFSEWIWTTIRANN